jgi:signal transduction histidine kinase
LLVKVAMPLRIVDSSSASVLSSLSSGDQEHSIVLGVRVLTNVVIALSFITIAALLAYLVWRGRDLPFKRTALAFGAFIVGGGLTFLLEAFYAGPPPHYLDFGLRLFTAVAAVGTALMLPRLTTQAIALARDSRAARERGQALESSVGELGSLYEKARAADTMKTRLFANVSHELRTPLTLVLGPAERLAEAGNLTLDQRRDIDVVIRNARTLLKHVNDLLDVSRLESGRLELTYFDADAGGLLQRAASHFSGIARERQIDLVLDCPEWLRAELDEDKIDRVFLNLLSNAFKVTPQGGIIRCSLREMPGDRLLFEVADSGPGVPPADRERIFGRFEKLDNGSSRPMRGTGLGLSIVREFVEAHRGTVKLDDAPEGGARFQVLLPRHAPPSTVVHQDDPVPSGETRAARDQTIAELQQPDAMSGPRPSSGRARVLVVEDNQDMNRFVRDTLSNDFQVFGATDGESGLAAIVRERPDLVVTDLMMPRVSGDELVRSLRRRAEFADLPVLVLTAKADESLRVNLLGEGSLDYILKPFSASELLARVRNLVAMKRARDVLQNEVHSQVRDLETLACELADQKRELASTLEAVRQARNQAEKASRVKSTFLRMVSHELRTPLAAIQLQVDRLAREADQFPDRHRAVLLRCQGSIRRLARLVESVLEYTRMESGRLDVSRRTFNPREIVDEVLSLTAPHAEQKELHVSVSAPDVLPLVESDPRLMRLVLLNLVENAVKFTEAGEIEVGVDVVASTLKLSVRDSGPGISKEAQALIFEPFEQIGPAENKHLPGIGLGLTLVREMVAALGGRVELHSIPGEGATFTVTLPIRYAEAVA